MTAEQIERLREWHRNFVQEVQEIGELTKSKAGFFVGFLSAVEKMCKVDLTYHNIRKLYLNGELISEIKE